VSHRLSIVCRHRRCKSRRPIRGANRNLFGRGRLPRSGHCGPFLLCPDPLASRYKEVLLNSAETRVTFNRGRRSARIDLTLRIVEFDPSDFVRELFLALVGTVAGVLVVATCAERVPRLSRQPPASDQRSREQAILQQGRKRFRCGQQVAMALTKIFGRSTILCEPREVDRYGRIVAILQLGTEDLNRWMVWMA